MLNHRYHFKRTLVFRTPPRAVIAALLLFLTATSALCGQPRAANPVNTPTITISPTVGPPTTTVLVSGSGFDPYAQVDIYFDASDLATATTTGAGGFGGGSSRSGIPLQVPISARPGAHWIVVIERSGHKMARKSFLVSTDWAQFQFSPDHKGVNPYENVLSPATVGNLAQYWSYQDGSGLELVAPPSVAGGMVFVAFYASNLYALNSSNGTVLWQYPILLSQGSPAVFNGILYIGSGDELVALNASTGALVWTYTTGNYVDLASPTVANGVVYFGSVDEYLYAVNASTGALLWKYETDGSVTSSPTVANGVVYVGPFSGDLYALNASTGELLWKDSSLSGGFSSRSSSVSDGVVYVAGGGYIYALNASNGAALWSYATGGIDSPAVANGVVYFGSDDGNLYALNASTGALIWNYTTEGRVRSSPVVANGVVYFGSDDGSLYALNASNGALLWRYTTTSYVTSAVVTDGVLYFGSYFEARIYVFHLPN